MEISKLWKVRKPGVFVVLLLIDHEQHAIAHDPHMPISLISLQNAELLLGVTKGGNVRVLKNRFGPVTDKY